MKRAIGGAGRRDGGGGVYSYAIKGKTRRIGVARAAPVLFRRVQKSRVSKRR